MHGSAAGEDLELRHYVDVLRRRKFVILGTILVALVAGYAFVKLSTPVYESTAQILLQPGSLSADSSSASKTATIGAATSPEVASEIAIMQSASVTDEVKKALHTTDVSVTIAPVTNSNVVGITASASKAKEATRIAQTYADTYVDTHRVKVAADQKTTSDALTAQITAIEAQMGPLDAQLNDLNTRVEATTIAAARAPLSAQRDQVATARATLDTRRSDLQGRLDRIQLDATVSKNGGVEIVSKATVPTEPTSPKKVRDLALALALGVIIGVAAAFTRDHFDDRIKSDEELAVGTDTPVLGSVPTVAGWRRSDSPVLVTREAPQSPAAEAYGRLATVLELKGAMAKLQVIQVAAARSGDGTTTTAANLGVAFAQGGRRVVLVDANLRRPRLHRFFGLENKRGLTSVLSGELPLADALVEVPGEPYLRILPSGPIPPNPAELLAGQSARDLITRLRFEGHLVLFDSPALPASEAMLVADRVDGVMLVAYLDRTTRSDLAEAFALLEHIDTPLVGTILNGTGKGGRRGFIYGREQRRASQPSSSPNMTPERSKTVLVPSAESADKQASGTKTHS